MTTPFSAPLVTGLRAFFTPEVATALAGCLTRQHATPVSPPPVAAFDCDQTVFRGDTGWIVYDHAVDTMAFAFGPPLYAHIGEAYGASAIATCVETLRPLPLALRERHFLYPKYRRLMLGANRDRYAREGGAVSCPWVARSFMGLPEETVTTLATQALAKEQRQSSHREIVDGTGVGLPDLTIQHGLMPFPAMVYLMAGLKVAGYQVALVSGSYHCAVSAAVQLFHLPVDACFGMATVVRDGRCTDELREPVTWKEGKPQAITEHFGRAYQIAAGDSEGDTALIDGATTVHLLIDREKPGPRRLAATHGWLVQPTGYWM